MIKKKNKFLTFVFSFLPGGGQMYMGFMKEGISLLSMFAFVIFLGSWLRISPIMFVLPVIWFYSFFDCTNKMSLPSEKLEALEDNYLFQLDKLPSINPNLFSKYKLGIAFLFIFIGLSILWNNIVIVFSDLLPNRVVNLMWSISNRGPQILLSIFIIFVGIQLISGKKEELQKGNLEKEEVRKKELRKEELQKEELRKEELQKEILQYQELQTGETINE